MKLSSPTNTTLEGALSGLREEIASEALALREKQQAANAIAVVLKAEIPFPDVLAHGHPAAAPPRLALPGPSGRAPELKPAKVKQVRTIPTAVEERREKKELSDGARTKRNGPTGPRGELRGKVLAAIVKLKRCALYEIAAGVGATSAAVKYHVMALVESGEVECLEKGGARKPAIYGVLADGQRRAGTARPTQVKAPVVASPREVAKVVSPPLPELVEGRVKAIEGEALEGTLRRAIAVLPERWTRPDLLKVVPLALTSGTYQTPIGVALAKLREREEIAFSPHRRTDNLQEYVRGPKWQ